jgi:hypothetical protein
LLWAVLLASGCRTIARPPVFQATPTLSDVIAVVNAHSGRVQSLQTQGATISVSQLPVQLSANIAMQREGRFRLKAGTLLTGDEADLGSNEEEFWFWIKQQHPPALYYCRHDRFAGSAARQVLPLEPQWLMDAFGVPLFRENEQHFGPDPAGRSRLRITSVRQTPSGPITRVTFVDQRTGDVLEQHLYDGHNRLTASALTSDHRLQRAAGVWLPHRIELHWPLQEAHLRIDVRAYEVNALGPEMSPLWQRPRYESFPEIDLSQMSGPAVAAPWPQPPDAGPPRSPHAAPTMPPAAPSAAVPRDPRPLVRP